MQALEVKSSIHELVDNINNIKLLQSVYNFLKENSDTKNGKLWELLTEDQKQEVLEALYESENDDTSIIHIKDAIKMR